MHRVEPIRQDADQLEHPRPDANGTLMALVGFVITLLLSNGEYPSYLARAVSIGTRDELGPVASVAAGPEDIDRIRELGADLHALVPRRIEEPYDVAVGGLHALVVPVDAQLSGRCALVVWAEPDRNQWLALPMRAVSEQLGVALPPPGIPGSRRSAIETIATPWMAKAKRSARSRRRAERSAMNRR